MSKKYLLKLYVMGETVTSNSAIANLKRICEEKLKGRYTLEIIDLKKNMQLAEDEKIFATPLLEKQLPPPVKRILGDLSDSEKVLFGIDMLEV